LELLDVVERRSVADRLVLRSLAERDVAELMANMTGDDAHAPLVRQVWRATGGNPFYATEVVRDLALRGGGHGDRTWQVPSGVRDVLRHRLQALPQLSQQVVCAAAVLGHEVEFTLLPGLVDQPEDLVIDAVEQAVHAGFLVESGSSWKGSYAFAHELTRDAVYADIPAPRRQRLHRRAAQALLSTDAAGGAVVAAAAMHMRAAGPAADPIRAAELSLQAAADAGRIYAWDEAVVHAEAAVEILDHVGAPARLRADAAVRAALLRLKASIGFPRAVEHLEAALEHYRAMGDDAALGSVHSRLGGALCLHHSVMDIPRAIEHFAAAERLLAAPRAAAFHLHRGLAQAAMYGLRTDLLGTASERAQELAAEIGRPDLGVVAGWGRAWFAFNRGQLAAASDIRETMWSTAHQLGDPYLGWVSVGAASLCATQYLLDPVTGRAWCRRGLAQARFETFAHPHETVVDQLALSLATVGELRSARHAADRLPDDAVAKRLLLLLDGDWETAEQSLAAAVDRDEQAGDLQDATLHGRWLAQARLLLGRAYDATAVLERALAWAVDGPQVPSELLIRAELARVLAAQGDRAGAAGHLARCDEIVGVGEDWRGVVGVVELARGAVASVRGHRRQSDVAYARALEVFGTYQLPWRRADALHAWAQSLLAAGHADEAADRHRAAWTAYEELGAAPRWRRPLGSA
jgi:tetratricopeptide (TPR) repeat protein